ncbi:biotin carboxylase N-terminal domain-containing protein [Cellulomonas algicola]|uniref:ATP-binding protein n=1 Tax=Cellulomonas algicola TaxID=2071633 RepID=UPI001C3F7E8A
MSRTTSHHASPAAADAGPSAAPLFGSVLVANRGEIACRVIATLRRLGIRSVAVYSDADRDARHVALADTAVRLGPAEPRASYLDVDAVVRAARVAGADAVHPGYGFLSENAELARACTDAGIVFVGPGVRALDVMGDKIRAKDHVAAAGVPVIPGASLAGSTDDDARAAADRVGYPVLVKPSAGGGGKGMTVVERAEDLVDALVAARRVAAAAFGDDTLLIERLVTAPRHIEVQVLADSHGHVVHLGERECSLQRRHQKVVEEAPSPLLDQATRARIGAAACDVARSVDYVGAGTVEFLVSDEAPTEFFFMEMNTRLQVEHPVTELVTGLDLVEQQLRVAAGGLLTFAQDDVHLSGHAVEARVYAEDPSRDFLPTTGTVLVLDEPSGDGVRVDSALRPGLEIGTTYDPMLAKVVAHGADRAEALRRLDAALAGTVVLGVRTNVGFLRRVLADPDVRAGRLDTGLLGRLLPGPVDDDEPERPAGDVRPDLTACVAAVLWRHAVGRQAADPRPPADADEARAARGGAARAAGPWRSDGWRLAGAGARTYGVATDTGVLAVTVAPATSPGDGDTEASPSPARVSFVADVTVDLRPGAAMAAGVVRGDATDAGTGAGAGAGTGADAGLGSSAGAGAGAGTGSADGGPPRQRVRCVRTGPDAADVEIAGVVHPVRVAVAGDVTWVAVDGATHDVRVRSRAEQLADARTAGPGGDGPSAPEVRAPMPGVVVAVDVATGDEVVAGQPLLTIEAMKMEHRLAAPRDGVVTLTVRPADRVQLDHVVATVTPHEGTAP